MGLICLPEPSVDDCQGNEDLNNTERKPEKLMYQLPTQRSESDYNA